MGLTDFSSHKALLIEDMAEARIMQKKMLTDFGFQSIDIAMKAETAIDLLKTQSFDLILSDYNLGNGKDGQQLLEEVRHSELIPNTATYLMVTAETSIEMVMGAIEFQPDGYITKPFSQALLQRRLGKLLEMKAKLKQVNIALDKKDFPKAIEEAYKVIEAHPSLEGKCHRVIGECYLEMKEYQQAKEIFASVLKNRKMPWAVFGEARACFYLNQLEQSESKFRQLMLDNRFFVSAYDWLAKIKIAQKDNAAAQAILIDAIERSPKNLLRQMELGKLSLIIKDYNTAELAFRRAVSLAKHSCYNTAEIYLNHLSTFAKLSKEAPLSSRQKETFQSTLKKIHQLFFDDPAVRAQTYSYETDIYLNSKDPNNAKNTLQLWIRDVETGIALAPTNQQNTHYKLVLEG
ncbi:response regulator [Marinomonas arenicola]|uniref:response regulator n=1 Tax=Marinomonas arenicola TaxID=569601 RepID=UPI00311F572F